MESGIKRTQRDYRLAFRLSVVEQARDCLPVHGPQPPGVLEEQAQRERQQQACQAVSMVTALRMRPPRLGARKLHHVLRETGIKAGLIPLFQCSSTRGLSSDHRSTTNGPLCTACHPPFWVWITSPACPTFFCTHDRGSADLDSEQIV